jgi:DNA-directed RNA polymerase II subunit RPB7
MFFLKKLEHRILLHPGFFGGQLKDFIRQKLYEEVEGTCTGRYGYIIAVASIDEIGSGVVNEGRGTAEFIVIYKAIVYKPFKGEVVEGQITTVNKVSLGKSDLMYRWDFSQKLVQSMCLYLTM